MNITLRPAFIEDLPCLTEIRNHYIVNTHITFDLEPYSPGQFVGWFNEHSDGGRYRLMVACDVKSGVLGYACTGRFRNQAACDTTVEASIACRPETVGRGVWTF